MAGRPWLRLSALTLALVLPILASPQEEPAPPAPPPPVEPQASEAAPPPEQPPGDSQPGATTTPAPVPGQSTWVDTSHLWVSRSFLWAVLRFDRFFADERDLDLPRTRSFLRWRNTLAIRDDGRLSYAPDLRVEAVLPSLDRRLDRLRLRLAVSATSPEAIDPLIPKALLPQDVPNRPYAAVVLTPFESLQAQTDLHLGALLHGLSRPPGWYTRARLRHVQPIGDLLVARVALAGFWQTDLGFGTRQELSLEHPLSHWLLLRLASGSMLAQKSRGWEWSSELALLAAAWPHTALELSGAALGATRTGTGVEVWRVQARARRDVYRSWVFLEVAPEAVWTGVAGGHRQRACAVILRLELQFDASSGAVPELAGP